MTRKDYLAELPPEVISQVLSNIEHFGYDGVTETLEVDLKRGEDVLALAFDWSATDQGAKYWIEISCKYFNIS